MEPVKALRKSIAGSWMSLGDKTNNEKKDSIINYPLFLFFLIEVMSLEGRDVDLWFQVCCFHKIIILCCFFEGYTGDFTRGLTCTRQVSPTEL